MRNEALKILKNNLYVENLFYVDMSISCLESGCELISSLNNAHTNQVHFFVLRK